MDEKQIRAQLAKQFKREAISGAVWKHLVKTGLVISGMKVGDVEWEDLVRVAGDLFEYRREVLEEAGRWRDPRRRIEKKEPELGAKEKDRAEALGEYAALRAALDPQVRHFRKEVLGGELLTPEQAYSFVYSPANRCFPIAWFQERRIPMREHHSTNYYEAYHGNLDEDEDGRLCRLYDIYIEPPGKSFIKVVYEPLDEDERDSVSMPLLSSDPAVGLEDWPVEIGSVLDVLRRVCNRLAKASGYAWREDQATWFVLTGQATPSTVLDGRFDTVFGGIMTRGTITLTAEPWVPAETVMRHYRGMQRAMLKQDNRPPSERSLALFRFVVDRYRDAVPDVGQLDAVGSSPSGDWRVRLTPTYQMSQEGGWEEDLSPFEGNLPETNLAGRPSWRSLQERWNQLCMDQGGKNQDWRYEDVRNFRRAVLEATRLLLIPPYEDELVLEVLEAQHKLP